MAIVKSNKLNGSITFGQLLGVGFSLLGAIIIFVVTVNVRLSNLENNQTSLKEAYIESGVKFDKFVEKFDKFTETLNDIKILINNKVDKK